MPELPEVETVVRDLRARGLEGSVIREAAVTWSRSVAGPPAEEFVRQVRGRTVLRLSRRAKFICARLSGDRTMLIHLRMTGRLNLCEPEAPVDPHDHVVLTLGDGRQLRFHDTRKFGRWWLVSDPAAVLGRLGPEPLDPRFTPRAFAERLRRFRRQLKPLLLDQSFVAGIGNIYADEALWEARLHPGQRSDTLSPRQAAALHRAIRTVLNRGIRALGTSLGRGEGNFHGVSGRQGTNQDALRVFRRTGKPCRRCGTTLQRIVVAQRSTHLCPTCQKA